MKSLLTLFVSNDVGALVEDDIAKLATDNRGGTRDDSTDDDEDRRSERR